VGVADAGHQLALERRGPGPVPDREVAAHEVGGVGGVGQQGGLLGAAPVLGVGAARRELAAGGEVDEVGRPSADGLEPGVLGHVELGDRLQQRLGVGVAHVGEQRLGRRLLHDLAGVHHGDVVGPPGHHAEVVGDQDHGHLAVALQRLEQVEDLRLHGDVERRRGLVGEEQLGAARQGDGDHDPLAHAARHLVGVHAQAALGLGDAHRGEQRERGLAACCFERSRCSWSDSVICCSTRSTGLSAVIGSWKTIAIWSPQ
jgi:hypothetical protein